MRYSHTHQINPQPGYWVTHDNRKLKILEMEIFHIRNCIRMIERNNETEHENALVTLFSGLGHVGGDGACMAIEHEISTLEPGPLPDVHKELKKALRRKEAIGFIVRVLRKVTNR